MLLFSGVLGLSQRQCQPHVDFACGFDPLHLPHFPPSAKGGHTVVRPFIDRTPELVLA